MPIEHFEYHRAPGDDNRSPAYCDLFPMCDWENWFANDTDATVASVLHILKRHPEHYREQTGNDPEERLHAYRIQLQLFARYI